MRAFKSPLSIRRQGLIGRGRSPGLAWKALFLSPAPSFSLSASCLQLCLHQPLSRSVSAANHGLKQEPK